MRVSRLPLLALLLSTAPFFQGCEPALITRAESGDLAAEQKLLAKPVPQEDKNEALIEAIRNLHSEVAALLLDNGADANARDELRVSALFLAVKFNERDAVARLLDHKADLAAAAGAYRYAHLDVARLLLDRGADPNARDADGATALAYAACEGRTELVALWLDRGADPARAGLACAKYRFDIEAVKNVCDDPSTALDCARKNGYGDIEKLLLSRMKK